MDTNERYAVLDIMTSLILVIHPKRLPTNIDCYLKHSIPKSLLPLHSTQELRDPSTYAIQMNNISIMASHNISAKKRHPSFPYSNFVGR